MTGFLVRVLVGVVGCSGPDSVVYVGAARHESACADGEDDDRDGPVDCEDLDCSSDPSCAPADEGASPTDCADGADNDDDGLVDCADAGCAGDPRCAESDSGECTDRLDNDDDGLVDCAEAQCEEALPGWCACARYVAAGVDCILDAGGDATGFTPAQLCAGVRDVEADYFTCLAEAYEGADCSTVDGLTEAGAAAARCSR